MTLELSFDDFVKLAANGQLQKEGINVVFNRPVLTEITADPKAKSGKVVFYLDETDPKVSG